MANSGRQRVLPRPTAHGDEDSRLSAVYEDSLKGLFCTPLENLLCPVCPVCPTRQKPCAAMVSVGTHGLKLGQVHCAHCAQLHPRPIVVNTAQCPTAQGFQPVLACRMAGRHGERCGEVRSHACACTSPPPIVQPGHAVCASGAIFRARLLYCSPHIGPGPRSVCACTAGTAGGRPKSLRLAATTVRMLESAERSARQLSVLSCGWILPVGAALGDKDSRLSAVYEDSLWRLFDD
jgi:hypothetical protein